MNTYDHKEIEPKWQKRWDEAQLFLTPELSEGEKGTYILDMFPYPSGSGLHVGHLIGYTGSDVVSRAARMQGKKVLHPMGWDSFGLPAENYAFKTGVHPADSTAENVKEYKRQLSQAGMSYDWTKELNTSDPAFYKWTQWLFTFLYEKGLAYRKEGMVNWCPKDQTVLANEQVVGGHCQRCGTEVIQKNLEQWYFKITDYAERLISDLDTVDWPEKIKTMQRNWIGKSEGARLHFEVKGSPHKVEVFTTRPDTIFGVTYLVLAPEHPLVEELTTNEQRLMVHQYQAETQKKSELERLHLDRSKTGVWTGSNAIHPLTGEEVPVWVGDYVLSTYGTGAVMAVPAHDERDYAFAQEFELPILASVGTGTEALPFLGRGPLVNAGDYTGKNPEEVLNELLDKMGAKREVIYRLRDWLVSRQRYWGAPIPLSYDEKGQEHVLSLSELPLELPRDVAFSSTGLSPLVTATTWREYTTAEGQKMTREADTLDGFVCSSWYFLRFPNPGYAEAAFDPSLMKQWLPVDTYMGGAEHAVMHLLYARFITKVLFDAGLVSFNEPFTKLRNQGMVLGADRNKMSKSRPEYALSPDEVIAEVGADTLRTYEMFMGPFDLEKPWDTKGMIGVRRFLEKVWRLNEKVTDSAPTEAELRIIHPAIKKVTEDIADFKFNTCVSTFMETVNSFGELEQISKESYLKLVTILSPFAPHITEELWEIHGQKDFASTTSWPTWDEKYLTSDSWECPVQINGKIKVKIPLSRSLDEAAIQAAVEADPRVQEQLKDKEVLKVIVVPGRLISYVIR